MCACVHACAYVCKHVRTSDTWPRASIPFELFSFRLLFEGIDEVVDVAHLVLHSAKHPIEPCAGARLRGLVERLAWIRRLLGSGVGLGLALGCARPRRAARVGGCLHNDANGGS